MSQKKDQASPSFKELLNETYKWPCSYTFKFIVPKAEQEKIENLFPNHKIERKTSARGSYTSITVDAHMESADVVIAVYEKASQINGLIAL